MNTPLHSVLQIDGRDIGPGHPCFIIAEAGINHNGGLSMALELVEAAAASGADAVKFQLYRVEEQVSRAATTAGYQQETTGETNMLKMGKSYDLAWEEHREIAAHCNVHGILYMASCFDPRAVDFYLGELGGRGIKIGSGELTNAPLLDYLAATQQSVLLSTGMATIEEVSWAVDRFRSAGGEALALFQCTSSYPTAPEAANLRVMTTLRHAFGVPIGFSDHTAGLSVSCGAVALGADLIEKHFTLDKDLSGPDHRLSLDPDELTEFVQGLRDVEAAMGDGFKRPHASEMDSRGVARRSLVSARAISQGEALTAENTTLKRPATGISPRDAHLAHGRRTTDAIPADMPITWDMLR